MRIVRSAVLAAIATPLVASAAATSAQATAAAPAYRESDCVIVLDKVKPGQEESRIVSRTCGSKALARANVEDRRLLMIVYQHRSYKGISSAYYGKAGPCDAKGYSIRWMGWPEETWISSFQTFNDCNEVWAYKGVDWLGQTQIYPFWSHEFVGWDMNDQIRSVKLKHV